MKKQLVIAASAAVLTLAGCAGTLQKPDPINRQELLAFAGFNLKVAVTQNDLDQIAGVPQRELLRVAGSNPPLYIWVDAVGCRCYYVGGEIAYRQLEELGWSSGRK
jgi:hypothetical protein